MRSTSDRSTLLSYIDAYSLFYKDQILFKEENYRFSGLLEFPLYESIFGLPAVLEILHRNWALVTFK